MTNEQIKQKLIKVGWSENLKTVQHITEVYTFYYHFDTNSFHITDNIAGDEIIGYEDLPLDRIKALVYGLTGEKI